MRAHRSFRHEALLYRDSWEFLDAVVPFITDGLALRQPVMVAVIGSKIQAIRAALGTSARDVAFVDMSELGQNPARIIPAWQRFIDEHSDAAAGHAVRGIGEPIWAGRQATEIAESQLHEGLLNVSIAPDTPLWLLCPYDIHALDDAIAVEARCSHPVVVDRGKYSGSTTYSGAYYVQSLFTRNLTEAPIGADVRVFAAGDLGDVFNRVLGAAYRAGIGGDRAARLATAVREIADDATAPGGGPAVFGIWTSGTSVVCEIHDMLTVDDAAVGRTEATTRAARRGLWRANQVCDLIQVRSNPTGTTVRVHTWI